MSASACISIPWAAAPAVQPASLSGLHPHSSVAPRDTARSPQQCRSSGHSPTRSGAYSLPVQVLVAYVPVFLHVALTCVAKIRTLRRPYIVPCLLDLPAIKPSQRGFGFLSAPHRSIAAHASDGRRGAIRASGRRGWICTHEHVHEHGTWVWLPRQGQGTRSACVARAKMCRTRIRDVSDWAMTDDCIR